MKTATKPLSVCFSVPPDNADKILYDVDERELELVVVSVFPGGFSIFAKRTRSVRAPRGKRVGTDDVRMSYGGLNDRSHITITEFDRPAVRGSNQSRTTPDVSDCKNKTNESADNKRMFK